MTTLLKNDDFHLLKTLVKANQKTLIKGLQKSVKKLYNKNQITATPDYIYCRGDLPVLLVAHCDTVFKAPPQDIYYDRQQGVIWSPQGLGADDRAGVYGILKILQMGFKPSILFTTDEEVGGIGARYFITQFPTPDIEYRYIIELDRQGECDAVFYECNNQDFVKYIESFGFIEDWGTFSDISVICPSWGIAGVNLSIGYLGEHSKEEILKVHPMVKTIEKVCLMLQYSQNAPEFEYIPRDYSKYGELYDKYAKAYGWYSFDPDEDDLFVNAGDSLKCSCYKCKKIVPRSDCIEVRKKGQTNSWGYCCYDCIVDDNIGWCHCCGNAFEKIYSKQYLCEACADLKYYEEEIKNGNEGSIS